MYIDYESKYKYGLPNHRRVYFDCLGSEFSNISTESKLLDIGYLMTYGYDIRSEIHATYLEHSSVSESVVQQSLRILYSALTKKDGPLALYRYSTDNLIDTLLSELALHYVAPTDYNKHYLK